MDFANTEIVETTPEPEPDSPEFEQSLESAEATGPRLQLVEDPLADDSVAALPSPEVEPPADPLDQGEFEGSLDQTLAETEAEPSPFSRLGDGVNESVFVNAAVAHGLDPNEAFGYLDTIAGAFAEDGVSGPDALNDFFGNVASIRAAHAEKQREQEWRQRVDARLDEGLGAPPDPVRAAIREELGPLLGFASQYQQERAEQQAIQSYGAAFQRLHDELVARGQKPPDMRVFGDKMVELGLLLNPAMDAEKATRLCWDHLRAQQPQIPVQSQLPIRRRDPRASFIIPGSTSAPPPELDDPLR
jgi:hypothetical protein